MNIISRKLHSVIQGTSEWYALRKSVDGTASEAPAAAGVSKYTKRAQLIKAKATGIEEEVSGYQERLFAKGHQAEESARAIAEEIIGLPLSPVTMTAEVDDLVLLASLDGADFGGTVIFEHKLINDDLRSATVDSLAEHYKVQMDQQLLVSGAVKCLFMASSGSKDDYNWFWYATTPERMQAVVDNWKQLQEDVSSHTPEPEAVPPVPISGEIMDSAHFPVVVVGADELRIDSRLEQYENLVGRQVEFAKAITPETDQDFFELKEIAKALKSNEDLGQDAIDEVMRSIEQIRIFTDRVESCRKQAKEVRLWAEKTVKTETENRRLAILQSNMEAWREWLDAQDCPVAIDINPDIAGAMKGKKSIKGWEDAAADAIASAKIEARKDIERIKSNYDWLKVNGKDHMHLFPDWTQLITADAEFMQLKVQQAIQNEQQRQEEERERIRQEEAEKLKEAEHEQLRQQQTSGWPPEVETVPQQEPAEAKTFEVSQILKRAAEIGQPEQVTIAKAEYQRLLQAEALLDALKAHGVEKLACWRKATEQLEAA